MNDLVRGSRPPDSPGCGGEPSFSKKPAIPAGCRSLEVALLGESEFSAGLARSRPSCFETDGNRPSSPSTPIPFRSLRPRGYYTSHLLPVRGYILCAFPTLCSLALTLASLWMTYTFLIANKGLHLPLAFGLVFPPRWLCSMV